MQIQIYESCSSFNDTTTKILGFLEKEFLQKSKNQNYAYNPAENFYNNRNIKMINNNNRLAFPESENPFAINNGYNANNINPQFGQIYQQQQQQKAFLNENMNNINAKDFGNIFGYNLNAKNQTSDFPFNINDNNGFKNKQKNNDFVHPSSNFFGFQNVSNIQIHNLQSNFFRFSLLIIYFNFKKI